MTGKAIETTGTVSKDHQLVLDEPLPVAGLSRVRVIVLVPDDNDVDEQLWLKAAAANPAFDFLKDAKEDIYSVHDGKPYGDQR